jgi:metal-responsive CopG/Arc/MetJ family transcriptional regulator
MPNIKTAISIDENVFRKAEDLADKMKISRSQLFSLALEKYLREIENRNMLEKINSVYEVSDPDEDEYMTKMKDYRLRNTNEGVE